MRFSWLVALITALAVPALQAAERPLAGSPGRDGSVAVVRDGCPTFSWGLLPGTKSWRLAVYRVETGAAELDAGPLLLAERLPGSFHSWTPSLERCLDEGRTYAWSVGAEGAKGEVRWSEPRLFRVPDRSAVELDEALEIVRRHFEDGTQPGDVSTAKGQGARAEALVRPESVRDGGVAIRSPLPSTELEIVGNIHLRGNRPTLRLDHEISTPQTWDVSVDSLGFILNNRTSDTAPFYVWSDAPTAMLTVASTGISTVGELFCTECVDSDDIEDGTVTGTDIADASLAGVDVIDGSLTGVDIQNNGIQGIDIAPQTIGASKLAADSVGSVQMAVIEAVAVECDGECSDSNPRLVCDTLSPPPYVPIAINCENINDSIPLGTDNCIGGDNDCSDGIRVDSVLPLDRWCSDGSGIDLLVFCLRQGDG